MKRGDTSQPIFSMKKESIMISADGTVFQTGKEVIFEGE